MDGERMMTFKEWMDKQYFSLYLKEKLYCEYEEFLDAAKEDSQ